MKIIISEVGELKCSLCNKLFCIIFKKQYDNKLYCADDYPIDFTDLQIIKPDNKKIFELKDTNLNKLLKVIK